MILGPKMLAEVEQEVRKAWHNLKVAQDRQKIYVDKKRTYKEFQVEDHVYIRIKPKKITLQWGSCTKLAPVTVALSKSWKG